jgi:hypothetical protein
MLLPARTAVLNYLESVANADISEIMAALKADYGHERQFTQALYLEHAMSLEASDLVKLDSYDLDDNQDLSLRYEITEAGRATVEKYIPKKFRLSA